MKRDRCGKRVNKLCGGKDENRESEGECGMGEICYLMKENYFFERH